MAPEPTCQQHIRFDAEVEQENARADAEMEEELKVKQDRSAALITNLEKGLSLTDDDLKFLAVPSARLTYIRVLRTRGHDPNKFADMFDILHGIACANEVRVQDRIKAANAYIARTREIHGLDASADDKKGAGGNTIIFNIGGDLIAGGKRNPDPPEPVREAEIID